MAGNVDNDWIFGGPVLDLKNAVDGLGVQGIGGQAINGFGRQSNDLSGAKQLRHALDGEIE